MKRLPVLLSTLVLMFLVLPVSAYAGPHLNLSPASGTYKVGDQFTVTIGVDSGAEKSAAVDAWTIFDSSRLEVVSIEKAPQPPFDFSLGKNINNAQGKFDVTCSSNNMSSFDTAVAKGDLVVVTLRAKSEGVAAMSFTCAAGSTIDTNIFNVQSMDVVDCTSNMTGSYTITSSGSGGGTVPTNTPAPTATPVPDSTDTSAPTPIPTVATTSSGTLPRTGMVENTVGLLIFGLVSVMSALFLRRV